MSLLLFACDFRLKIHENRPHNDFSYKSTNEVAPDGGQQALLSSEQVGSSRRDTRALLLMGLKATLDARRCLE